jgi:hypothetical protein
MKYNMFSFHNSELLQISHVVLSKVSEFVDEMILTDSSSVEKHYHFKYIFKKMQYVLRFSVVDLS